LRVDAVVLIDEAWMNQVYADGEIGLQMTPPGS
jgi:hypothetical protein